MGRSRSSKARRAKLLGEEVAGALAGQPGCVRREETCRRAVVEGCSDCGVESRPGRGKKAAGQMLEWFVVDSV